MEAVVEILITKITKFHFWKSRFNALTLCEICSMSLAFPYCPFSRFRWRAPDVQYIAGHSHHSAQDIGYLEFIDLRESASKWMVAPDEMQISSLITMSMPKTTDCIRRRKRHRTPRSNVLEIRKVFVWVNLCETIMQSVFVILSWTSDWLLAVTILEF